MWGETTKRPALTRCLKALRPGDTLTIWTLDRLGHSLRDLIVILDELRAQGVKFRSLTEAIDTETPIGRARWQMIGGLAELERSRGRGVQFGQKSKLTVQKQHHARQLLDQGQTVQEVAALFNVHRATGHNEMDPPLCGSTAMGHNEFKKIGEPIEPQEARPMKQEMNVLGIDIAKHVFHAVGMDDTGKIVLRKRLSRHDLVPFVAKLPIGLIGIEACSGAHYWARRFRAYGHEVKLMAPQFVKPYVKSNKNDSRDAEAIAEAVTRPTMRFVPTKDVAQQDIQELQRVRERLMGERTALVNEVPGLMHEYGIVMPKGVAKFRQAVVGKLEAEKDKLTPLSQEMFWKLVEEFAALEEQLAYYQEKLEALATTHPECQRLMTIPGIGPLSATALVAAVSDASAFKNGRQFATWLGLVPRQHSPGGKERLLGISKRGDSSLRKLLIHGARATMRWVGRKTDRRSQWIRQLSERRGKNRTAVALANKNARIVWALLTSHQAYEPAKG